MHTRTIWPKIISLAVMTAALFACGKVNSDAPLVDSNGKHPTGWIAQHGAVALVSTPSCTECHGKDLTGGISKVSCMSASPISGFSCHATSPADNPNHSFHPAGWTAAGSHGSAAKAVTPGLGSCTKCHGADYKEAGKSCMTCHTTAPHPQAPWHGTTTSGTTHTTTNQSNVTECSRCHAGGAKLTTPGAALAGATCFNNTLCHGAVGHPAGWEATGHQIAAKAAAGTSTGLDYCRKCHGTDFRGGTTGFSCFQCHTSSPHSKPWLSSTGATTHKHISTDATNALACGRCHAGGVKLSTPATPPANSGCFNSTLCHASATGHTSPYPGSAHLGATNSSGCLTCHAQGNATSSYPVSAGTPPNCRGCHLNANPGTTPQCSDCHGTVANNSAGALMAGRPVGGTTFPNRPGMHNISEHVDWACTICHPFTTGDPRHGWSNGVQSTAAQVGGTYNLISSWNAATKSCTALCHTDTTAVRNW